MDIFLKDFKNKPCDIQYFYISVADPHHFDGDPDPLSQNDVDPCGSGSPTLVSMKLLTNSLNWSGSRIIILNRFSYLSLVDYLQCPSLIGCRKICHWRLPVCYFRITGEFL
jgi:hypothetical protein